MKHPARTQQDNEKSQLENEISRLKKKIEKYEAIDLKQNRFGLVWLDVPEAFENDVENKLPILEEVPKLAINSKDDKPTHLLIEGDNYHALTCLNYTHKGKVDVIYIDPPYNTGSDGFKYKDKRILEEYPDGTPVSKESPLRHSYWLSFMRKRLELAKDILKDTGIIFISIDDNESSQLKMLCDEIFGDSNFLIPLYIQVRYPGKTLVEDMDFQKLIETVYVYGKSSKAVLNREKIDYSFDKFVWQIKEAGKPKMIELGGKKVGVFKKGQYEIVEVKASQNNFKEIWASGKVLDGNSSGRFFRDYLAERKQVDGIGTLYKVYGIGNDKYDYRYFTGPKKDSATKGIYYQGVPMEILEAKEKNYKYLPISNYYNFADSFGNCRMEGGVDFRSGKKPISFIKFLLKLGILENQKNIVLDFFAGSGSTGHAVLDLNEEMQLDNQFILVTNNDEITNGEKHKIMTGICYPRVKNVIKGYGSKNPLGNSVKYFKTAFVGKNNILQADDADKIELAHNAGGMLAIAENTFEQVEQNNYWQIFESPKQYTAVYFREEFNKFDDFIEKVKKLKKPATVYIFSWEKEFEFSDFEDYRNIKVKTIPQPILEIYKQIYNLI